jgi:hypothetical protein
MRTGSVSKSLTYSASQTCALKVYFNPLDATSIERTKRKIIADRIMMRPLYFRIFGPFDVYKNFKDKLDFFFKSVPDSLRLNSSVFKESISSLKNKLIINGIEASGTRTTIKDWRILINFSNSLKPKSISESGCIKRLNPFPDFFTTSDNKPLEIYQYYAGKRYHNEGEADAICNYNIVIVARPSFY